MACEKNEASWSLHIHLTKDENDSLLRAKEGVIQERNLSTTSRLLLSSNPTASKSNKGILDSLLVCARILQLTESELYFLEPLDSGPYSPRNEIQALSSLATALAIATPGADPAPASTKAPPADHSEPRVDLSDAVRLQNDVLRMVQEQLDDFCRQGRSPVIGRRCEGAAEAELCTWATENGCVFHVHPAEFPGTGRGAAASKDLHPGDVAVEVPQKLLLYSHVAEQSPLGAALLQSGLPLEPDTLSLVWTIAERANPHSHFASFFRSLPTAFNTGLSMRASAMKYLRGSVAYHQLVEGQEHLRTSYDSLFPLLSTRHPSLLPPSLFTFPAFLWAAELWYAYGMKIAFPDGATYTCLVPIASLLNHSIHPHITAFSRLDPLTRRLTLRPLRRVGHGEECTLSYGPMGNKELMQFYGFGIELNPYDGIKLDFPAGDLDDCKRALIEEHDIRWEHMVRRCTPQEKTTGGGGSGEVCLPSRLMGMMRVLLMDDEDMDTWQGNPRFEKVSLAVEEASLQSLIDTLGGLMEMEMDGAEGEEAEAVRKEEKEVEEEEDVQVRLAKEYRKSEQGLLESVVQHCLDQKLMVGEM